MLVRTIEEVDHYFGLINRAAADARAWVAAQPGEPLIFLRRIKFDPVGYHPITHNPINLVEQINQTWTYAVALAAVRQLLVLQRPRVTGWHLVPTLRSHSTS